MTERVRYRFESGAFPGESFDIVRAHVSESLDACFDAEVLVRIPRADEEGLLMLAQDATLTFGREGGPERRVVGVATQVEVADTLELDTTMVMVRVEPALALLDQTTRSRIFQEMTVEDILQAVLSEGLGAYGREVELSVDGPFPTREYCVQYGETDLAFAERLMQEEGIHYAFDHSGDAERMTLRDRNAFPELGTVPFVADTGRALAGEEPVYQVEGGSRPTTDAIALRDHDWTAPAQPKSGTAGAPPRESYEVGLGRHLTISDYGGVAYGAHDGDRQAPLRLEAAQREALVVEGASRAVSFAPGATFMLSGHGPLDGEYLLTAVEHLSLTPEGADVPDPYQNRFRAIPKDTVWRPERTRPKPRVPSVQTAIVTGPGGEEIFTDEHGRVKVRFHWDLGDTADERSSCFLRVQQPWAGSGWGFVFLPRIGMEVVVHFVHGDPDRPVVHGCVYNSEHRPPYALPAEKTKSTIKSASTPGESGFNELRFEDLAGSEQIFLHAQKDLDEVVLADHTTSVGGDQTNTVGNDQTQNVDGYQTEQVDGDQTMTVDVNRKVEVVGKFTEIILGGEERTVTGAESETITGGETRIVIPKLDETFSATETRFIIGGQKEIVVGGIGHDIAATHDDTVTGMLNQISLGAHTITSGATALFKASSLFNIIALGGMSVSATAITVDCSLRVKIDPVWFAMEPTSSSNGGTGITLAGIGIDVLGVGFSMTIAKLELTGAQLEIFGAKASATGIAITFGAFITEAKAADMNIGFRIKLN